MSSLYLCKLVMRNKDIYIISSSNSLKASSEEYVDCFGGIYTHPIIKLSSVTHDISFDNCTH